MITLFYKSIVGKYKLKKDILSSKNSITIIIN